MTGTPHPRRCAGCQGTGWTDGPPIIEIVGGRPHPYTTVIRCEHDFWNDDLGWQPEDELLPMDHPRAQAAFDRGYLQGAAELEAMRPKP